MSDLASALFAVALSDGGLATTCPGFRDEYQITPDGSVRINHPPAAPFDPFAADEPEPPTTHDLASVIAEQHREADREDYQ